MTPDEEIVLLTGLVNLKIRMTEVEKRMKEFIGNPMCPLCREVSSDDEAFIRHFKTRHLKKEQP